MINMKSGLNTMKQGLKTASVAVFTYTFLSLASPTSTMAQIYGRQVPLKPTNPDFVVLIPLSDSLSTGGKAQPTTYPCSQPEPLLMFPAQTVDSTALKFFLRAGKQDTLEKALADLDSALLRQPGYADALYLKGRLLYNAGDYEHALQCYRDADSRQMFSGTLEDFLAYGELLLFAGKTESARVVFLQGTAAAAIALYNLEIEISKASTLPQLLDLEAKRQEIEDADTRLQSHLKRLGPISE